MKLRQVGSNMTELEAQIENIPGVTKILFSYETPVAAMNLTPKWHERFGSACIKTDCRWSRTTTRHINKWLDGANATPVEQKVLDDLV